MASRGRGYTVGPAKPEHDAGMRRLLQTAEMPGAISISMEREPSFHEASEVQSPSQRHVVVHCDRSGDLVAMCSFGERELWVNGEARSVPLLSEVRIRQDHRGGSVLARGLRYLKREVWGDSPFAQLIIVRDNTTALELFAGRARALLPQAYALGDYESPAVPIQQRRRRPALADTLEVRRCRADDLESVQSFVEAEGRKKQLFPRYDLNALDSAYYRGLKPGDFFLAYEGSRLRGVAGVWDQSAFKQTRVTGYAGWLSLLRPVHNLVAPLIGSIHLPPPGQLFHYLNLHTVVTQDNSPEVFAVLFDHILEAHRGGSHAYILAGFDRSDPLLDVVTAYGHQSFGGRHLLMSFDGDPRPTLQPGPYHLEAARI